MTRKKDINICLRQSKLMNTITNSTVSVGKIDFSCENSMINKLQTSRWSGFQNNVLVLHSNNWNIGSSVSYKEFMSHN